jgi:hypothetical protein
MLPPFILRVFERMFLQSPGFSKDGKTAETQIILGLLVCKNGYPLSYSIFNGAQSTVTSICCEPEDISLLLVGE